MDVLLEWFFNPVVFSFLTAPLRFWCRISLAPLGRLLIGILVAVTFWTRRKGALCTGLFVLKEQSGGPVIGSNEGV